MLGEKTDILSHSSMFMISCHTTQWRCQCKRCPRWEVPAWSWHLGIRAARKSLETSEFNSIPAEMRTVALQHRQTEHMWLADWPQSATANAYSALSSLKSLQENRQKSFPSMHLFNCFYVPLPAQHQSCRAFGLKPPPTLVHRSIFVQRRLY